MAKDPREAFLELVNQRKQPLAARLRETPALEFSGGRLSISVPQGDPWISESLSRENNRAVIDEAVREIWGSDSTWRMVEVKATQVANRGDDAAQDADLADSSERSVLEHPIVQSALDLFSGTIEAIDPLTTNAEGEE